MAKRIDELTRYRKKVTPRAAHKCWHWHGGVDKYGYGVFYVADDSQPTGLRHVRAHRYTYELKIGPIPAGKVVGHSCTSRDCQNPAHLLLMNPEEPHRRITHCPQGHEYTPENTIYHSKSGARMCRTCTRNSQREYMRNKRRQEAATVVRPALNRQPVAF